MSIYFKNVDLKTFLVRRLRQLSLFNKIFPLGTGGSPEYSFRVWVKHYKKLKSSGVNVIPDVAANGEAV